MSNLWIPGMAAGPLEDFVNRLHRQIREFEGRRGNEAAVVELELLDGATFSLHSLSPEPGFGFITLRPYPEDDERPWAGSDGDDPVPPDELIIPVGAIKRILLNDAPDRRGRLGFSLPSPG